MKRRQGNFRRSSCYLIVFLKYDIMNNMKVYLTLIIILSVLSFHVVQAEGSDAFTHSIVGAGIAHKLNASPFASFLIGVASHIPLDIIPHYEVSGVLEYIIDGLLTVGGIYILMKKYNNPGIFWGAAGGVFPDIEHVLEYIGIMEDENKVFPTHSGLIKHGKDVPGLPGIGLAVGINAISIVIFF